MQLYQLQDLKKGEFLCIKRIKIYESEFGSDLCFYGEIPHRYAAIMLFTKFKKKKKIDLAKAALEIKTQEQLEGLLNKIVYPCFVEDKCVGYKLEVDRCES